MIKIVIRFVEVKCVCGDYCWRSQIN